VGQVGQVGLLGQVGQVGNWTTFQIAQLSNPWSFVAPSDEIPVPFGAQGVKTQTVLSLSRPRAKTRTLWRSWAAQNSMYASWPELSSL